MKLCTAAILQSKIISQGKLYNFIYHVKYSETGILFKQNYLTG